MRTEQLKELIAANKQVLQLKDVPELIPFVILADDPRNKDIPLPPKALQKRWYRHFTICKDWDWHGNFVGSDHTLCLSSACYVEANFLLGEISSLDREDRNIAYLQSELKKRKARRKQILASLEESYSLSLSAVNRIRTEEAQKALYPDNGLPF